MSITITCCGMARRARRPVSSGKVDLECGPKILWEERGPIRVKGIAYPIATYGVIGLNSRVPECPAICVELPHVNVEVALELMSADERAQAAAALRKIVDQLAQAPADALDLTAPSSGELLARADEVIE